MGMFAHRRIRNSILPGDRQASTPSRSPWKGARHGGISVFVPTTQRLSKFSEGVIRWNVETPTSSTLLVTYFLMCSTMLPCAVHSDTVANRLCSMPPGTLTSFRTLEWNSEF